MRFSSLASLFLFALLVTSIHLAKANDVLAAILALDLFVPLLKVLYDRRFVCFILNAFKSDFGTV
jgi:hypothetical protein